MLSFFWFHESIRFAYQALRSNPLRTLLSLLGVTIGIFVIITVLSLVDSMEINVRSSFKVVGEKVLFVQKWPISFEDDYPWWKYYRRPVTNYNEFKALKKRLTNAEGVAISGTMRNANITYFDNSLENIVIQGITHEFDKTIYFNFEFGRYFLENEIEGKKKVVILGYDISKELFNEVDPTGKTVKIKGIPFLVIGVLKKQGNSLIGESTDFALFIPFTVLTQYVSTKSRGFNSFISIKCKPEEDIDALEAEAKGVMRSVRRLKPGQEDNFSVNRIEMLLKAMDTVFKVMGTVGWVIGGFSMLVGGFGIANIMFVSVKERTHIIGIKKSLGAKNSFILAEFLFESVLLSLLGGLLGIFIVIAGTMGLNYWIGDSFTIHLTAKNFLLAFGISGTIGMIAGIFPAMFAAALNPVDAIRAK